MERMEDFYRDVRIQRYGNGLKLIYKHFPSQIVGIALYVDVGSGDEGKYLGSGIAHLTEHLVFEGRRDLDEELRRLGAISNAYTTLDHTLYYLEVPKENLRKALELFIPTLFKPSISVEVFQREREVVLKEQKFRDDEPGALLVKIGFENSYLYHPYKFPVIGEAELLKKLRLEDVVDFHSSAYLPNNSVIAIAGDLDFEEVKRMIEELTSELEPAPIYKHIYPSEERNFYAEYVQGYPGKVGYFFISFPGVSVFDQDLEGLDLLADYLGWGKDSPFYRELVKSGLAYSVSCINYTPQSQGLFVITAVLEEANYKGFFEKLRQVLERVKADELDEDRIERLKKRASYEFLKEQEAPLSVAKNLARDEGLTKNYKFALNYLRRLYKIDGGTLSALARKYLNLDSATVVRLIPEEESKKEIEKRRLERQFKKLVLENGLKVILCRTTGAPLTAITLLFEGGVRFEDERINGISQIIPRVLITSDVQKKFEELGGRIKSISGNNSLGFEVEVPQAYLRQAIQLLKDLVLDPELDEEEFQVQVNVQLGKLRDLEIDLFYQSARLMRKLLYKRHPYRMMPEGEEDSLRGLKLSDLEEFIERFFVPNNSVISIAGEIEFDEVEEILRDSFNNWGQGELKIQIEYDKPPEERIYKGKRIPQREVIIEFGFMVPSITTEARYYLDILQALVSGQGSLFFNRIRKGLGGAYTLGATMFLGPDPGLFSFYVATTPEKREEVMKVVHQILEDLRKGKITEEELGDAKEMLRTKFYRDTLTASSISFRLAIDELLGIGYEEIHDYLDRIEAITKEDLVEFIKEYIDPNKAVLVEVGNI